MSFGAELLLPDFHPFGIGKLRVVDADASSEHTFQAFGDLRREGDFGKQVEHLLSVFDGLPDEMDVDFRLSAGGDTMEQADVFLPEVAEDGIIGCLLGRIERIDGDRARLFAVKPSHFV